MKAAAMSVWIFINLLCFGMCGYLYLIWSQYWLNIEKQKLTNKTPGFSQRNDVTDSTVEDTVTNKYLLRTNGPNISFFESNNARKSRRSAIGAFWNSNKVFQTSIASSATQSRSSNNVVIKSQGSPRFPNIHTPLLEFDSETYVCSALHTKDCEEKTKEFKELLLKEFYRVLMGDSKVFKSGLESLNHYNVQYSSSNRKEFSKKELLCALKRVAVETVTAEDEPFKELGYQIPTAPLQEGRFYNTCAVVTSAGALLESHLGRFIDTMSQKQCGGDGLTICQAGLMWAVKEGCSPHYSVGVYSAAGYPLIGLNHSHDMVLRFNNAPTENYTDHVGSKTTFRILNSQVVAKPEYDFLNDPMYNNVSILIWDPANFSSTLNEWYNHSDFPLFPVYKKLIEQRKNVDVHLLKPKILWDLWSILQDFSSYRLRKNPPSSGFIGIWFALHRCSYLRVFEYVPSVRASRKCHYYGTHRDPACTLGAWHPLAQEKAIAERIRDNSDLEVFQKGFISIHGFRHLQC